MINFPRLRHSLHAALVAAAFSALGARLTAATPTLIWSDDFNQADNTAPDSTKWSYDIGGGGWGNNELETYTSSTANSYVTSDPDASDGKALVIQAVKDSSGNYTSARLKTEGLFNATYGHIEARLKTTSGKGLWPAFWMLGSSIDHGVPWPNCGEIDVMEVINAAPATAYGTLHGPGYSGANGIQGSSTLANGATYNSAYHVFSIDWSPGQIVWAVDGVVYQTLTPAQIPSGTSWVFDNSSFFIIMNLAVGGYWPGNPDGTTSFPAKYSIDYVRVYGLPPVAPTGLAASAPSANVVSLSWSAPANLKGFPLTGYLIERATDSGFTANLVQQNVGVVTSSADDSVAGGTSYFYRISAITTGGTSDPTSATSVTTPAAIGFPVFTVEPVSQVAVAGASVTFTAAATGTPAPTYQWQKNSADIAGATGTSYTIASVTAGDAGTYAVVATNSFGSTKSSDATLTVTQGVNAISYDTTTFPATAVPGASLSFTTTVTNTGTNAWGPNHYLVLRDPNNDNLSFASLNGVAAGASTTVTLTFAAPVAPGAYTYYIQGLENNVAWFSARSTVSLFVAASSADFNGDGHADILWSNTSTGDRAIWYLNGTGIDSFGYLAGIPIEWKIVGTADFDGDGQNDILWEDTATGDRSIWLMSGTTILNFSYLAYVDPVWHIAAIGDFNGDGHPDVIWENTSTGDRAVWYLNGTGIDSFGYIAGIDTDWHIVGAADVDGDGQTDLIWENLVTGDRTVWFMNGATLSSFGYIANIPGVWHIAMVADFDGDGHPDLLWENTTTGDRAIWLLSGTTLLSAPYLAYVDPVWSIAP